MMTTTVVIIQADDRVILLMMTTTVVIIQANGLDAVQKDDELVLSSGQMQCTLNVSVSSTAVVI